MTVLNPRCPRRPPRSDWLPSPHHAVAGEYGGKRHRLLSAGQGRIGESGGREGNVEVGVTDCGIAIAPELQEPVFERFVRVDSARSRATAGTGLGLALAKHGAANHEGRVRLWNRPDTGSTFTLQLPAYHDETTGVNQR